MWRNAKRSWWLPWTCQAWSSGLRRWQSVPVNYWWIIMISSPLMIMSWDVLVRSNIALRWPMTSPLKNDSGVSHHHCWRKSGHMWMTFLQAGAIWPSSSPWCNMVVLIQKKDGGLHFCIDLNVRTKKDSYPLPHIQETLESLEGSCIFSSFDFKLGFWQVEMDEASKQYTAFTVGSLGFFECEWMPFRLCNTPATFQQLMQNCLGELNLTYCLIYLDDVITFSNDEDDHLHWLHEGYLWQV